MPLDSPSRPTLAYRPELDGIRGLAILAVLAQHINIPNTQNAGAVGVNLFFVLSGFLITSLLMTELRETGKVSLRNFYERRIRRLLPALLAMLVVTGALMALQGRLWEFLGQAGVSVFYVSNVAKSIGYDLGYVGHTWSLALEEQFYLLWPAVFLFLPRRFLVPGVLLGIAGSVTMQIITHHDVLAAFRPDTRADAILWGCLIALAPVSLPRPVAILSAVALVVISASRPGPLAIPLASIFSVGLVAGAASLRGILSSRLLVRIGQISYGLYLWHAIPVGLLMPQTLAGNVLAMAVAVGASFALALVSERWIERPFRHPRRAPVSGFASDPAPQPTAAT